MVDNNNNWQNQAWQQPTQSGSSQPQQPQTPQPQSGQKQQTQQPSNAYYAVQPQQAGGYYPPAPVQQKRGKGWIVALVAIVLFFILMAIGVVSCSGALGSVTGGSYSGSSTSAISGDTIGVINIDGTIQYDGTTSSPEGLKAQLDRAEEDSRIKAVVLRVNSGGGTATAGEEMATYVSQFSKPIVVSSASMNASAAYLISSQTDYIYTAKTTAIGSIGTAMQVTDLSGLYEKLGISIDNITSAESKDTGYGTRPLTEEERAYYQSQVDQINATFLESVSVGRSMDYESVRSLATGMTFTGMEAVENGLADSIGTLDDACAKAASLAGISSYETVTLYGDSDVSVTELLDLLGYSTSTEEEVLAALRELKGNDAVSQ